MSEILKGSCLEYCISQYKIEELNESEQRFALGDIRDYLENLVPRNGNVKDYWTYALQEILENIGDNTEQFNIFTDIFTIEDIKKYEAFDQVTDIFNEVMYPWMLNIDSEETRELATQYLLNLNLESLQQKQAL